MKLTRLRLTGFKSFVEPTDLVIEPGLTGVVGPNGCGKSNLLEALRWVMGESSPKSMRGQGMEDVIFAGTAGRPSRNSAEVSVVIDNAERLAPAALNDQDTLEITRRIERDAGSVYRINGRDVRQRDVQILFADASTGAHSPALVRQGQISELINMKPKARRAILEEAAGISGLHARRHEAELRLRGAETNLERLNDVIQEIEVQLAGLRRQARQATRYRNLSGEIRQAEALVLHLRWSEAERLHGETQAKLRDVTAALHQATQDVVRLTSLREDQAEGLPERREAEAAAAAALQRLKHEQETLGAEEVRARRRAEEIRTRIGQLSADLSRENDLVREAAQTLASLADETSRLREEIDGEADARAAASANAAQCAERTSRSEAELEAETRDMAARDAERSRHRRDLDDAERRLGQVRLEIERIARDRASLAPSAEEEAKLAAARAALGSAEEDLARAEREASDAEHARSQAQTRERAAREPLQEADKSLSALRAEVNALTRLLQADKADLWPPLIDAMDVSPGFEVALGAVLGDELSAPADEAAPVHWRALDPYTDAPSLPAGAQSLSAYVRAPAALTRRLGQIGLVATLEDGARLQPALLPGQRLVTRKGDLWRWDGYCASSETPSPAAQRLEQHNRLKELRVQLARAEDQTHALRMTFQSARSLSEAAGEAEANSRAAMRHCQSMLNGAREELSRAERMQSQTAARLSAIEERGRRARQDETDLTQRAAEARGALDALGDDAARRTTILGLRERLAAERIAASEARAKVQTLERETKLKAERIERLAADSAGWSRRQENSAAQVTSLSARIEAAKAELADADAVPGRIEAQRTALLSRISDAEATRAAAADSLALSETALRSAETHLKEAEARHSALREQRARLEAQAEGAKERGAEVEAQIRDIMDCEPAAVLAQAQLPDGKPLPDLAATESRLERLRRERENLGGVNLRAEEEATEAQERLDGLTGEKADLEAAIAKLRSGISSLNREGRERILAAFAVVNGHFERLFTRLFGGGEAKLELVESDDPLEAGLEILARPPGKRLSTMSLMSGGEQTLTAMSLIFAVFLSNPAPICVLDEVDAPLDDSNVDRFCTLLSEMTRSSQTRFLVITHHPMTMARMDRLYGVTMGERGVSQLVSVDLTAAAAMRAAG